MKTFYITTPIYYPNARPHVGSAYTTIVCDVIARYKRMCGYDVAFLTGTDEHGEKLERAAAAEGLPPHEFVAEKRKLFIDLWKRLGIDDLRFVYTDQPDHITTVWRMLALAQKNSPGVIYKGKYEGRYCVSDERYVSDGTDPVNCDICGRPAELISEENHFFRLSAFQERLLKLYEEHPEFVRPDFRRNEVLSFVRSGLRDISISRKRLKWGIPWPNDPEQVFYVWYDALTSYMTGLGYAQGQGGNEEFQKYWRNKPGESEIVHMIGKDILRFHAVYWPAFIMAAYPEQPEMLPTMVFAHGWIYYEQDKMSKSKGNVVYPEPIIAALNSFGAPGNDALRYYLLREAPFGQDMSFSYEGLIDRYNSDLANDFGNLANRTLTMIDRYLQGVVPSVPLVSEEPLGAMSRFPFRAVVPQTLIRVESSFLTHELSRGLEGVWHLIATTNQYLNDIKPWALAEDASQRALLANSLCTTYEILRFVAVLAYPVLPLSMDRLWHQLGLEGTAGNQRWSELAWDVAARSRPEVRIGKPEPIFPRLDKAVTLAKLEELAEADRDKAAVRAVREAPLRANVVMSNREREKPKEAVKSVEAEKALKAAAPNELESQAPSPESRVPNAEIPTPSPEPARISIEDFAKVDMRVGEILAAEAIPGAKKLLKLQVDIGTEVRQVCAGIAEHYQPEQLVGMKVVLVANLQPRKLRGIESNGMIVAASVDEEGKPVLATFKEDVPKGARLK